jgi:hypothetical protein
LYQTTPFSSNSGTLEWRKNGSLIFSAFGQEFGTSAPQFQGQSITYSFVYYASWLEHLSLHSVNFSLHRWPFLSIQTFSPHLYNIFYFVFVKADRKSIYSIKGVEWSEGPFAQKVLLRANPSRDLCFFVFSRLPIV